MSQSTEAVAEGAVPVRRYVDVILVCCLDSPVGEKIREVFFVFFTNCP